jgi:hypothetical protein
MRMLGHDLRHALARATSITERLARHLVAGAPTHRDLGELRYALSEADYVAEALLDGSAELNLDRPPLCVNSFLIELEPSLKETLNPGISLSVRLSATAGVVSATRRARYPTAENSPSPPAGSTSRGLPCAIASRRVITCG